MLLRIAHMVMLFNIILFVCLVASSCDTLSLRTMPSVSWTVQLVNGEETAVYECKLIRMQTGTTIGTYRICDNKQECNDYCEGIRKELAQAGKHGKD